MSEKEKKNIKIKKNIEIKVDPETGVAKGNLFKRPIVTNSPHVTTGKKFSGKIKFNKNKTKIN
tara:strand:- start:941 stop:1129 length:189 start_codon:yes stop_codon:yes gene_type:complete